jgi:hypothetical protein
MAVMAICILNIVGYANNSYMWARLCFYLWPVILLVTAVRAGFMSECQAMRGLCRTAPLGPSADTARRAVFQLNREQNKIIWECNNGGQLWGESVEKGYGEGSGMPTGMCSAGFHSLYIAFVMSLLVDLALQIYA